MICKDCRKAGTLAAALETNKLSTLVAELGELIVHTSREHLVEIIEQLHDSCRGDTWCDCHHRLTGINWTELSRAKTLQGQES